MRFNRKIKTRNAQRLELSNFLGVDFSSSSLDVSNRRASSARNFINVDGINAKRNGWKELYKLPGKINGIHTFRIDGDDTTIVYSGKKFYRVSKYLGSVTSFPTNVVGGEVCYKTTYTIINGTSYANRYFLYVSAYNYWEMLSGNCIICGDYICNDITDSGVSFTTNNSGTIAANQVIQGNLTEARTSAFVNDNKIWIIGCGDYLVYGNFEKGSTSSSHHQLRRVENNIDTYISTTTIGIRPVESDDTSRSSLDGINMLNKKRKNRMKGDYRYLLTKDDKFVEFKSYYTKTEAAGDNNDDNNFAYDQNVVVGEDIPANTYYERHDSFNFIVDSGSIDENSIVTVKILKHDGTVITCQNSSSDYTKLKSGGRWFGNVYHSLGKLTLFTYSYGSTVHDIENVYLDSIDGEDNIEVTFEYSISGLANRINKCKIGVAFGYGSAADRIFVSGNQDFCNLDFYSEMDNFSYFAEENVTAFGTTSSAIKSYSRLGDGTLAVLKEQNTNEPTIYFRSASTYQEADGTTRTIFPIQAGALGEGAVCSWATANLSGDNLFLSSNGVYGIVLSNNITTNERYARERSKFINAKLVKEDLSNAVGIVYKNKYFLAIEDATNKTGNCYILDARYKSTSKDNMDDTFNYECWFWDNIPARVWTVQDGQLYFGTSEGRVCVFDDEYFDVAYQDISAGNLTIDFDRNRVTVNTTLLNELKEKHLFKFTTNVYEKILDPEDIIKIEDNKIFVSAENIVKLTEYLESASNGVRTDKIFVDQINGYGYWGTTPVDARLSGSVEYKISDLDLGECSFRLENQDNEDIEFAHDYTKFRLCANIKDEEVYVSDVYEDSFNIRHLFDTENIDLILYNNGSDISANTTGKIIYKDNVVCEWYSPVLDLGLNDYSKDLESLTITLDPIYKGLVQFGYETKIVTALLESRQIQSSSSETRSRYFSFEDIDFNNFTFDTAFASSFTKRVRVRNLNYIMFKFKSSDDKGAAVNSINLLYTVYKKNRGVR